MNLKQYIEKYYLKKKCEIHEQYDGYGYRLRFGGNIEDRQDCMITEVYDDFIVAHQKSSSGSKREYIIPFAMLSIQAWKGY